MNALVKNDKYQEICLNQKPEFFFYSFIISLLFSFFMPK